MARYGVGNLAVAEPQARESSSAESGLFTLLLVMASLTWGVLVPLQVIGQLL
jgi:hypothetical protein